MEEIKQLLGEKAAEMIPNHVTVGIGSGTTSECFIKSLAKKCSEGLSIKAVASSEKSFKLAKKLNIPIFEPNGKILDYYVDGADQVDSLKQMIKGKGGALLREKILATNSIKRIIMIDYSKYVKNLGNIILPVEVSTFCASYVKDKIKGMNYSSDFRFYENSKLYLTDNGNNIIDMKIEKIIDDPRGFHQKIKAIPGVVETGIFINLADVIILGKQDQKINFIFLT